MIEIQAWDSWAVRLFGTLVATDGDSTIIATEDQAQFFRDGSHWIIWAFGLRLSGRGIRDVRLARQMA